MFTESPSISVKDTTSHEVKGISLQDACLRIVDFQYEFSTDIEMAAKLEAIIQSLDSIYSEAIKKGYIESTPFRGRTRIESGYYYCPHIPDGI